MKKERLSEDKKQFIEKIALEFEFFGIPRMGGRILGWLTVCDPPHQTGDQISEAIGCSKSSVSSMTQLLLQRDMIERVGIPKDRKIYYKSNRYWWADVLRIRVVGVKRMREITENAFKKFGRENEDVKFKLAEMLDYYRFLDRELPLMWSHWLAKYSRRNED
jgi:DNA-binding transcriptional regulator GbsR (MarR family)